MDDYRRIDIWQLARIYRNPMGPAPSLEPGKPTPAVHMPDVEARRGAVRGELQRRGLSGKEIDKLGESEAAGHAVIREYLSRGGSRFGDEEE